MKRLDVGYSGGYSTILFSVRNNRFYSYEQDREEIHQKYGGCQYYESRSGLTGAGWIEGNNDLIPFGYYRVDIYGTEQRKEIVHFVDEKPIWGYAPIISHGGIDRRYPFVLTDGNKVAFVHEQELVDILLHWKEIEAQQFEFIHYSPGGYKETKVFRLYNKYHYSGVRATRFIDLREEREYLKGFDLPKLDTVFSYKLNIFQYCDRWFHWHPEGVLDMVWYTDPRNIVGHIVAGWYGNGSGVYARPHKYHMETFIEIPRRNIANGKYYVEGKTPEWVNYEQNFTLLEWYAQDGPAQLRQKVLQKARHDYISAHRQDKNSVLALMQQHPEVVLTLQDSYDAGNCQPGTESFIRQYKIELSPDGSITVGKLLENKHLGKMLNHFDFRKVIVNKLLKTEEEL